MRSKQGGFWEAALAGLGMCVRAEELLFSQKIERLKSELHLLDAEGKSPNKHVFFLDTRREGKASTEEDFFWGVLLQAALKSMVFSLCCCH